MFCNVPVICVTRGIIWTHTPDTFTYPETHQQSVVRSVAGKEDISAGHAVHAVVPDTLEYVPAMQLVHTTDEIAPTAIEYVPAEHVMHALVPDTPEYVPARQFVHTADEIAPTAIEYVPAVQFVHAVVPDTPEYVPAGQLMHTADEIAPTSVEYAPAEQAMHALEPVAALYCPAEHSVHVRPAGPVYPASHAQSNTDPAMPSVCEFGGHRLQFALPSGDHCPAGQYLHVSGPVAL